VVRLEGFVDTVDTGETTAGEGARVVVFKEGNEVETEETEDGLVGFRLGRKVLKIE